MIGGQVLAQPLAVFGCGFDLGLKALDGGGYVVAANGQRGSGTAQQREVVASSRDGAKAADEFNPDAAADALRGTQQQRADLPGGPDVGSSAGIEIIVGYIDEADGSLAFGQLAQSSVG